MSIPTDRFPSDPRPRRSKEEVLEHLEQVVERLRAQTLEMDRLIADARRTVDQLPGEERGDSP